MHHYFKIAAQIAKPTDESDPRNYWIGSVGIRKDGVIVSARNCPVQSTDTDNYKYLPNSHAEGRVLRKLGKGGDIYVARVSKINGKLAMSMPCPMCQVRIKSFEVNKVFYTVNEFQYGVWNVKKDTHNIFRY